MMAPLIVVFQFMAHMRICASGHVCKNGNYRKHLAQLQPHLFTSLSGSESYKDNAYGEGNDNVFLHEFAVNYQINPRMNVRYFANWNENLDFSDGSHRIEINYQL